MTTTTRIFLAKGKERSAQRFHPWIFSGAIQRFEDLIEGEKEPENGAIVHVFTNKGQPLGTGHYNRGAVAVRLFSFEQIVPDQGFWVQRIEQAVAMRKQLGLFDLDGTNAFRLVHGEGDGLPGLVIDRYADTAVIQTFSAGMHQLKPVFVSALQQVLGPDLVAIYDKSSQSMARVREVESTDGYLLKDAEPKGEILENGNRYAVNWEQGQKTGFFLDQRLNRQLLGMYSNGRTVLNTYAYSGGFSVSALQAGATRVDSVDSSSVAMALLEDNLQLNGIDAKLHQSFTEDAIQFLKAREECYDVVVLDPPAFAKSRQARHRAVQAYKRLNVLGINRLNPGGILFTFSCSEVVDREMFQHTVTAAAIECGRNIRVLHALSQPPDHARNLFHAEGEYLKGLVVRVD